MTCHIYAMVKILSNLGQVLVQASYTPELLTKKPRGSDRERVTLVGKTTSAGGGIRDCCLYKPEGFRP